MTQDYKSFWDVLETTFVDHPAARQNCGWCGTYVPAFRHEHTLFKRVPVGRWPLHCWQPLVWEPKLDAHLSHVDIFLEELPGCSEVRPFWNRPRWSTMNASTASARRPPKPCCSWCAAPAPPQPVRPWRDARQLHPSPPNWWSLPPSLGQPKADRQCSPAPNWWSLPHSLDPPKAAWLPCSPAPKLRRSPRERWRAVSARMTCWVDKKRLEIQSSLRSFFVYIHWMICDVPCTIRGHMQQSGAR